MSDEIARIEREADADDIEAAENALDGNPDLEAPEADIAEQHTELLQQEDDPLTARPAVEEGEADPADAAEQRRVVALDEDDYR
ncbi:hypothetical protein [Actinacidiphila paucisporea]|uniref:Uncharacterized protein n=1 Tax=Actinacidiphila paucisporea TaxID=310782 RepID=A0A1M6UWE0_9ACTN|nr:hypothetical protein [Actinacidiphila paucisporea]SHK73473.1 hypothetical protein SAMN05216499_101504 [Actinacidiphila paucisporea]